MKKNISKSVLEPQKRSILAIGKLTTGESITTMLEAYSIIRDRSSVNMVVAVTEQNRGEWDIAVSQLGLHKDVALKVADTSKELAELYTSCDLFLDASVCGSNDFEAHEVAVLEALKFEVPVITTTALESASVIEHGKTALVVDPSRACEVAAAVCRLIDNGRMLTELAKRGATYVNSMFDFTSLSRAANEEYEHVTGFTTYEAA